MSRCRTADLIAVTAVCLLLLAFLLQWWASYLGVTNDGWHALGAWRILHGEVPYRDYYLFIPPFHQLKLALLTAVFGPELIALQVWGLLERLVLAGALYFWLRRAFAPAPAAAGVAFGMLLYLRAQSETLSSMIHEAALWPALSGAAAAHALAGERRRGWWAAAGALAGVAFWTKQTTGVGVLAALGGFLALRIALDWDREVVRDGVAWAAGWLTPGLAIGGWLAANGAFGAFADQVFLRGPSSKGSLDQLVLRPFVSLVGDVYEGRATLLALAAFAVVVWLSRLRAPERPDGRPWRGLAVFAGLAGAALVAGRAALGFEVHGFLDFLPEAVLLRLTVLLAAGLTLTLVVGRVRGGLDERGRQLLLLALVSASTAIFASLSWALMLICAIPGTPLLAAYLLSLRPSPARLRWAYQAAVVAGLFGASVQLVHSKLATPFFWAGWREPVVTEAVAMSELDRLAGIRMSPETKRIVETMTRCLRERSQPDEPVLAYPHVPIFYLLAERAPLTFAPVHYWDVCPDYQARADAAKLRAAPPPVFVYFRFSDAFQGAAEATFRGGARSGQREMEAALEELTETYELLAREEAPGPGFVIEAWAAPR